MAEAIVDIGVRLAGPVQDPAHNPIAVHGLVISQ